MPKGFSRQMIFAVFNVTTKSVKIVYIRFLKMSSYRVKFDRVLCLLASFWTDFVKEVVDVNVRRDLLRDGTIHFVS